MLPTTFDELLFLCRCSLESTFKWPLSLHHMKDCSEALVDELMQRPWHFYVEQALCCWIAYIFAGWMRDKFIQSWTRGPPPTPILYTQYWNKAATGKQVSVRYEAVARRFDCINPFKTNARKVKEQFAAAPTNVACRNEKGTTLVVELNREYMQHLFELPRGTAEIHIEAIKSAPVQEVVLTDLHPLSKTEMDWWIWLCRRRRRERKGIFT